MYRLSSLFVLLSLFYFYGFSQDSSLTSTTNPCADYWKLSYQHPYLKRADSLWEYRQSDKASTLYEIAAKKFEREANWKGLVKATNRIGQKFIIKYSDSAITVLMSNIEIIEKRLDNDAVELAELYLLMGSYYDIVGRDPEQSLLFHQKSLSIKTDLYGEKHVDIARSYRAIGELYRFSNRYQEAIINLSTGADIMVSLGCENLMEVGLSYYYMASSYRMLDDQEKAIIYAQKALSVYNNYPQKALDNRSNCYSLLANIYQNRGDLEQSKYYNQIAINMLSEQPSLSISQQRTLADYLNTKALLYSDQEEYDSAFISFRRSLHYYHKVPGSAPQIARILQNIGISYTELKQYDSAHHYLMNAVEIRTKNEGDKGFDISSTLRFTGDLYQEMGILDSALHYYQSAVVAAAGEDFRSDSPFINPGPESFTFDGSLLRALEAKGTILRKTYEYDLNPQHLEYSLETFNTAMDLMDRNRDLYELEGSTLLMANSFYKVFEEALNVCHTLYESTVNFDYLEKAFLIMEKSKARLLFDSFDDLRRKKAVGIPDSVIDTENRIKSELLGYSQELEKAKNTDILDNELINYLEEKVFQKTVALESYYNSLESSYPSYTSTIQAKLLDLNAIRTKLSERNAVLLTYFWGDSSLYSMVVKTDKVLFFKQEILSVEQMAKQYQKHLIEGPRFNNQSALFTEFTENAFQLYQLLFKGVENEGTPLIIAADGLLRFIPVEGLVVEKSQANTNDYSSLKYVVHLFPTTYVYSANLWAASSKRKSDNLEVLGFSHSSKVEFEIGTNELAGTAKEIEIIRSQMSGTYFSGLEATKQRFMDNASKFDIIHLAIHGISDSISHLENRLLFRDPQNKNLTEPLYTHELYKLRLKSQLTVLSACESGLGRYFRGEGVYSMSRAFSYAGCPTTVMSLWQINDKTTPEILGPFYRLIEKGLAVDQSLQQAKLDYLTANPGNRSHPGLWAAMVVHGQTDPLARSSYFLLSLGLVVAVVLTGILLYRKHYKVRIQAQSNR